MPASCNWPNPVDWRCRPEALDLLEELFRERHRCTKSVVDVSTHNAFGVEPTTFGQFARRHAAAFVSPPGYVAAASRRKPHDRNGILDNSSTPPNLFHSVRM
jgi:hypothetical protein